MRKTLMVLLLAGLVAVWVIPAPGAEYYIRDKREPSPELMAADTVAGRPVGVVATATGFGLFIVSLPFSIPSCSTGNAARGLVREPASWTFRRGLGEIDAARYPGFELLLPGE